MIQLDCTTSHLVSPSPPFIFSRIYIPLPPPYFSIVYSQKIIIVNRLLQADGNGILKKQTPDIDVEVRTVWQPWLRRRCDFVARYIVPNRANIVKILESKGRFRSEVRWVIDALCLYASMSL